MRSLEGNIKKKLSLGKETHGVSQGWEGSTVSPGPCSGECRASVSGQTMVQTGCVHRPGHIGQNSGLQAGAPQKFEQHETGLEPEWCS